MTGAGSAALGGEEASGAGAATGAAMGAAAAAGDANESEQRGRDGSRKGLNYSQI